MSIATDRTLQAEHTVPSDQFRLLFESSPSLELVLTPDFRIVAVSDAYLRATMTERDSLIGRGIFDVFPDDPDDPQPTGVRNLRASLERVLGFRGPDTMAVQKYPIRRPASEGGGFEERHWSPVNSPVLSQAGEVAYIVHRVEDVTEVVRLQQSRHEQEKLTGELRTHAEGMESEIFVRSRELAEANHQLRITNDSMRSVYEQVAGLLDTGPECGQEIQTTPTSPEQVLAKVTELIASHKQIEAQFRQAQKMEAVGRLAGGVAHDFNNLLTVILGYSALATQQLPDKSIQSNLKEIVEAAERGAALTTQLLAFSRKQPLRPIVLHLSEALSALAPMAHRLIGADIEIVMSMAEDAAPVEVDPSQFDQVFMNLVVNARDAMPDGGKLVVELRNHEFTESTTSVEGPAPGAYVLLSVKDNGIGMTSDVRQRIFEPFFTTKEEGKGTGLGLAVVYGVVHQSRGHIIVESALGVGTTFKVFFPAASAPVRAQASGLAIPRSRGTETILVVDDSPSIGELVRQTLSSFGYKVLVADSGKSAVDFAERHDGQIHLLVTDLVLPKVGGKEIAEAVTVLRPGIRVMVMSGHPMDDERVIEATKSGTGFIQKPFGIGELRTSVREFLDAPKPIRRVLVVDDEPSICDLLVAILRGAGYEVATANDGQVARECLRRNPADLLITDLSMPEKDGIETIGELRKEDPTLRIIAMSGIFGDGILRVAGLLGAHATLKKPLTAQALLECVHSLESRN